MAEDSKISIDSDWKKQAQEEKKRLAEQEAARKQQQTTAAASPLGAIGTSKSAAAKSAARENQQVNLESMIQTFVTQALVYLGDMPIQGRQNMLNLDMAKNFLDMLTLLDEKTHGNLTVEEKGSLDAALYETRMRYIAVASRYAELV
jgi:flagellar basal body L-ring protein FlgH